ncbi:pyridoxine 5'-phosphate synthase [bacterium]|nr:pyridoxine 5'-phosphate synthase [bacterium]
MARLGVNVENAALLRKGAKTGEPDPVSIAVLAELGGADGIVCRLRKESPLITERDIRLLREVVKTHLNIQIAPEQELLSTALSIGPDMITLMPEKRAGSTEGGGFDILGHMSRFEKVINEIRAHGIVVSIVVDPVFQQVKAAAKAGADYIELQMSRYAEAEDLTEREDQVEAVRSVAIGAVKIGMGVSAGTGLDYHNVSEITAIESIEEVNIGHAVLSRAMSIGMDSAVRDMVALVH